MGSAKHFLSWHEIDHCVLLLRDSLQNQEFDEIVGITRGGLVAGVLLAHALGMRSMSVIELQITHDDSIESEKFDDVRVIRLPERDRIAGRRVLLADDIVGSGRTMMKARQLLVHELAAASLQSCALVVNEANLMRSGSRELRQRVKSHLRCTPVAIFVARSLPPRALTGNWTALRPRPALPRLPCRNA